MSVDPSVLPGLVLLALELLALAAFGFVVARVALGQTDDRMALAQGLVIGPALWGLLVNFILHLLPGLAGAVVGWTIMLALGVGLAWRVPSVLRLPPHRRWVCGCDTRSLLDRAGQSAVAEHPRRGHPPRDSRNDPSRPIPASPVLDSGLAPPLPLRRRPADRTVDAAGWPRSGVHDRIAGRLHLDRIRLGYCNSRAAAWGNQRAGLGAAASHRRRVDAGLVRQRAGDLANSCPVRHSGGRTSRLREQHLLAVRCVPLGLAWRGVAPEHLEASVRHGLCVGIRRA